jgi:hypothetical protein
LPAVCQLFLKGCQPEDQIGVKRSTALRFWLLCAGHFLQQQGLSRWFGAGIKALIFEVGGWLAGA